MTLGFTRSQSPSPAHVVDQVRHPDLAPRTNDADSAHNLGSHAVLLITEHMLDACAHLRARRISSFLRLTEFVVTYRRLWIENIQVPAKLYLV